MRPKNHETKKDDYSVLFHICHYYVIFPLSKMLPKASKWKGTACGGGLSLGQMERAVHGVIWKGWPSGSKFSSYALPFPGIEEKMKQCRLATNFPV